ncbi:MAG TPA: prepilin-type N-terminal cleavage/methylation domain-containing protein [Polyangiaceae bacterium]|nr:prepilin-type N-terminal cleavage/methylation domain-containing protein [Polyangiaceae bacterium]
MKARGELEWGNRASRRGFTLIELLVSLTGGLFVSLAVFALARDASRFYQREGRLASATLSGIVGFERLRADIARAGFLSTPNVSNDPFVCSRPNASSPTLLRDLSSLRVVNQGSPTNAILQANSLAPDSLLLMGSYSSPDEFIVRDISREDSTGGAVVTLLPTSAAMARLGFLSAPPGQRKALLQGVFATGRALRIVDNEGRQHFGVIQSANVDPTGTIPEVRLSAQPALEFRPDSSRLCGLKAGERGARVNVINFIRYDVRNLNTQSSFDGGKNKNYAALYTASKADALSEQETARTELVRTELDVNENPLTLTQAVSDTQNLSTNLEELVAEYAVDFQLEAGVAIDPPPNPSLQHFTDTQNQFAQYVGKPTAGASPERLRSVRVRLSLRSREADRAMPLVAAGGLYRVGLGSDGKAPYARVRSLQADVMLNNNAHVSW